MLNLSVCVCACLCVCTGILTVLDVWAPLWYSDVLVCNLCSLHADTPTIARETSSKYYNKQPELLAMSRGSQWSQTSTFTSSLPSLSAVTAYCTVLSLMFCTHIPQHGTSLTLNLIDYCIYLAFLFSFSKGGYISPSLVSFAFLISPYPLLISLSILLHIHC